MKIYDEEEILQEIGRRSDGRCSWVLILARKEAAQDYSFDYCPSDSCQRLTGLWHNVPIVLQDGGVLLENQLVSRKSDTDADADTDKHEASTDSLFVAKALFSILDGETLMIVGSPGWMLAVKEKFKYLQSLVQRGKDLLAECRNKKKTVAEAAAAAVLGGGVAAGVPAAMCSAHCFATAIMSWEAVAGAGGVAAANMSSMGAAGVLSNPFGLGIVGGGALIGSSIYWFKKKRKKAKRQQKEEETQLEDLTEEEAVPYSLLGNNKWFFLSVSPSPQESCSCDEPTYRFIHKSWKTQKAAEQFYFDAPETNATANAKALFNPQGEIVKSFTADTDVDGWETALTIRYISLLISEQRK